MKRSEMVSLSQCYIKCRSCGAKTQDFFINDSLCDECKFDVYQKRVDFLLGKNYLNKDQWIEARSALLLDTLRFEYMSVITFESKSVEYQVDLSCGNTWHCLSLTLDDYNDFLDIKYENTKNIQ